MSLSPNTWTITGVAMAAYGGLTWAIASVVGGASAERWWLTGALWILGLVAAAAILWYLRAPHAATPPRDDLDALFEAAHARLMTAHPRAAARRRASVADLPALVVLGREASAKTTSVIRSELKPALLAGSVDAGDDIAPTDSVNVWYAGGAVLVEAGPRLLEAPERWARLVGHLQPDRRAAVLGRGSAAPRAALVCVSCEEFVGPSAVAAASAEARALRPRLAELARQLGVPVPVYVLFTKLDRVRFFADYFHRVTAEEAREVLGATLPIESGAGVDPRDERETRRRVGDAFGRLFEALADRRGEMLGREPNEPRRCGAYEFPREFRRLGAPVTQFLVELSQPSHLDVSPVLRGFYFSGVQPMLVTEAAAAPVAPGLRAARTSATGIFSRVGTEVAAPPRAAGFSAAREVPRWLFLDRLFSDVILTDDTAARTTGAGTRVLLARRAIAAGATAAAVFVAGALTVSWTNNRRLVADARAEAAAVAALPPVTAGLPGAPALARLDALRARVLQLAAYERDGRPWGLAWGLYAAAPLHDPLREAYFRGLNAQGLRAARLALADSLRALPDEPTSPEHYAPTYATLRAHLVVTSNPERSDSAFLVPVLLRAWQAGGAPPDAERVRLAQRQLAYYNDELRSRRNPYRDTQDAAAVQRAQAFLTKFDDADRVYQLVVARVGRPLPSVTLAARFPSAAGVITDDHEVPGAFTLAGWRSMQEALRDLSKYLEGEGWVLGAATGLARNLESLRTTIGARYAADYAAHWLRFVRRARVEPFSGPAEAARRLELFGGPASPLLGVLSLAARNTAVDDSAVVRAFQPVHAVVAPADTLTLRGTANEPYLRALGGLTTAVQGVARAPTGQRPMLGQQVADAADAARNAVRELASTFIPDTTRLDRTVSGLLAQPIEQTSGFKRQVTADAVNAAGRQLCDQLDGLFAKYPFNPDATAEATALEVAEALQPQSGTLWTTVERDPSLSRVVRRQDSRWVPAGDAEVTVDSAFLSFLRRAGILARLLFPDGAPPARINVTFLGLEAPAEVNSVSIRATTRGSGGRQDSASLGRGSTEAEPSLEFRPASAPNVELTVRYTRGRTSTIQLVHGVDGTWGLLRLLDHAEEWQQGDGTFRARWAVRLPNAAGTGEVPQRVVLRGRFDREPQMSRPRNFGRLGCVARVAR
jgi:type VI secretion system protein ImpL